MFKVVYAAYFVYLWENNEINYATNAILEYWAVMKKNWVDLLVVNWKDDHNRMSNQKGK